MYTEDVYMTAQQLTLSERKRLAGMLIGDVERAAEERGWSRYATTLRHFANVLNRADIDDLEMRAVDQLKNQLNRLYEQADEREREGLPDCTELEFEINCLHQEIRDLS